MARMVAGIRIRPLDLERLGRLARPGAPVLAGLALGMAAGQVAGDSFAVGASLVLASMAALSARSGREVAQTEKGVMPPASSPVSLPPDPPQHAETTPGPDAAIAQLLGLAVKAADAEGRRPPVTAPDRIAADAELPALLPSSRQLRSWMRVEVAARRLGRDIAELERLVACGRITSKLSPAGKILVTLEDVMAATLLPPEPTPAAGSIVADEAIRAGRVRFEIAPIYALPSRKLVAVEGELALLDTNKKLLPKGLRPGEAATLEHDLLTLAVAAATVERRPANVTDRPLFVRVSASSLAAYPFHGELLGLCEDLPDVARELVLTLKMDAFARPDAAQLLDGAIDQGVRLAIDLTEDALSPSVCGRLIALPAASFVVATARQLLAAASDTMSMTTAGLQLVANDVASEREIVELLDLGVAFITGPLLALPRPGPVQLPATQAA